MLFVLKVKMEAFPLLVLFLSRITREVLWLTVAYFEHYILKVLPFT